MNLFPNDDAVEIYKTAFEPDILGRRKLSKQLSDLVERIDNPVVMALDDSWGTGKSYFLKRWVSAHKLENDGSAITVYFDAFESDYLADPLVSLITSISERIPDTQNKIVNDWKSVAAKLAKPAFGVALSIATFGAKQQLEELGDAVVDAVSAETGEVAEKLWKAEQDRKQEVEVFKSLLVELTKNGSVPVVIVVDELDRCRPDFALSLLEIIKHFFSVPKVHFILGVNTKALESSVRARYGEGIDAKNYLKKFINISFSLPRLSGQRGEKKVIREYSSHIIEEMKLPRELAERCANLILKVSENYDVSLRDIGKIFSRLALVPSDVFEKKILGGWTDTLFLLIVSLEIDPNLHSKLSTATASTEAIRHFLNATKEKTQDYLGDSLNESYDHETAFWLVTAIYACGAEVLHEVDDLPSWVADIGRRFDQFGFSRNPKVISSEVQRDWVDVFRT
jgi:hypothetical protein